ncbi:MBOAT family O-acyltransferase [Flavonifractor sp. An306]|uniref:MBOAT family O-acyltransferase n=1 Tax=Flavonifractor sp. An306 TaxID=1965629 RepID=UPI000B36EB8C|nr:MBOAT family O-acyltransferase [Flavonifractor sp. An306]OUO39478.1 hypothetical protein B5F88_09425 [Flavonifractor sp. An306]
MWYLQADTLVWILGSTLLYGLAAAILHRVSPQRRLTPFLLLFDLGLLFFVSWQLALFYVGYTLVTYAMLRILKAAKGQGLRRILFVLFCALCAAPFFYARFALMLPFLPAIFTLVGFAYNMLKAIDGVFYVYYADKDIPLIAYANFLLFFPVLTSGPILRYRDFERDYLSPKPVTAQVTTDAVKRLIRGMFKKMVLVALLGLVLDRLLAARLCLPVSLALIVVSYFTLYFDLSGYSDIAIAVASFTGFSVAENFKNPLTAASFTQFWRKWHVTLSDWIREHIFVVVNGKRLGRPASAAIGMCTMLVMSMWHGFSVKNLVCGAFMGGLLALENLLNLTTADRRRMPEGIFRLRCLAVNFAFGINALSFSMDLGQMADVVKGLFRL